MTRTTVKKAISIIVAFEIFILLGNLISYEIFINMQIAALSSFLIIAGSMYAHKKLISNKLESKDYEEKRDTLDEIEDPYELYEETDLNQESEQDIKAIIKEEKKKIKTLNLQNLKKGSTVAFSPFRIVPYIFLILGFIALKNHGLLNISAYLFSLLLGITAAYMSFKKILSAKPLP